MYNTRCLEQLRDTRLAVSPRERGPEQVDGVAQVVPRAEEGPVLVLLSDDGAVVREERWRQRLRFSRGKRSKVSKF